ncbi:Alpha/beta hydrolase fold-1 [Desarmillaria tabescens]|uniref:Alpha/beta hydrolase fold-1 n=1 Tax=Armillaria tabescens TaxID=1929756 RepID=A0AA39JS54_ARMTA|nr:Alpha/beta hydrolase fold-1 [Desarmillaria tabescens]KAK0447925.1 Alpha/beta hydrolase fold-1 [Desarmillaria tabescens]
MFVDNYTVETQYSCPLKCTVKRYRQDVDERPGFILIFAHGTGFHKEHWEVTIQRIFALDTLSLVREAWAVDAQTHGDAAALNEEAMKDPDFKYSVRDYAEACANVYKTYLANRIQKGKYRVILIGHSAGASSAALATSFLDHIPFAALVLIEPTIWPEELTGPEHDSPIVALAAQAIPQRRDHWKSREDARRYLVKRIPWNMWDPRILDIYVEHGLRPDTSNGGVRLKCPPRHEAYPFVNIQEAVFPIAELERVKGKLAVHLVYGEREEMISREKQEALQKVGKITSVTQIPDAGHLVVQEAPDLLGDAIWNIIRGVDRSVKL